MFMKKLGMKKMIVVIFVLGTVAVITTAVAVAANTAHAQAKAPAESPAGQSPHLGWALIAAAVSTGLGCLGAGVAVSSVGAAAVGAVAEKPQITGRALIFVGLAEGIAIYGLIIAIMILAKV